MGLVLFMAPASIIQKILSGSLERGERRRGLIAIIRKLAQ
jgi:hypothetical protein